jgi:ubiquinol-cytochrome c reductase cytochrome b subunit
MKLSHSLGIFFLMAGWLPSAWASSAEQHGAKVYADYGCRQCHSIHHDNGGVKGPDLSDVGTRLSKSQIKMQILQGGRQMPPFAAILEKSEANDLVAYLASCRDQLSKQTSSPR